MQYTAPHYYKKFKCIAENCPDTCCAGWQIQIDPASLKKYRSVKGPLGNRLKNEINWKERCFRRYGGRCAFLNEKGLCDLYLEGNGERSFCRTCRTYPRHIEEFEGLRELSLSISCPAAAEIILGNRQTVRFLHAENPERAEPREEDYEDFDYLLFTKLMDARALILELIQNRAHPLSLRAAAALSLSHDLQERIDRNALFDADRLMERYASPQMWDWFENRLEILSSNENRRPGSSHGRPVLGALFSLFDHLEILREDWPSMLASARRILAGRGQDRIPEEYGTAFEDVFDDITGEQLLVYFVCTYFCGAVYNGNAYGKMKFAAAGLIFIRELSRAKWIGNSGKLSFEELIMTAVRYSREVEHSDHNKITMERLLDDENLFGLEALFSLLHT